MGLFEETVVKAKDAFDIAAKKTGEVIATQKLKVNVASINSQIAKDYETLGRLHYDTIKNSGDNSDAVSLLVNEIDIKLLQVEEIEAEIANNRKKIVCTDCGATNVTDALFCNKCGKRFSD